MLENTVAFDSKKEIKNDDLIIPSTLNPEKINTNVRIMFRLKRKADSQPLETLLIEEATLPNKKKKACIKELTEQLNMLNFIEKPEEEKLNEKITLLSDSTKNATTSSNDKLKQEKEAEIPKYVLKLANINTILNMNDNIQSSKSEYISSLQKHIQKDYREDRLNSKRNIKIRQQEQNNNNKKEQSQDISNDSKIAIVDMKSTPQNDIIYCNNKPMHLQMHTLINKSNNKNDSEYIEDYYYLQVADSNYGLEKVRGKLFINESVHEYLAPYFYPDGSTIDDQKDLKTYEDEVDMYEDPNNPDNYDSNAEDNPNNDYGDEPNSGNDDNLIDYDDDESDDDNSNNIYGDCRQSNEENDDENEHPINYKEEFINRIKKKIFSSDKDNYMNNEYSGSDSDFQI